MLRNRSPRETCRKTCLGLSLNAACQKNTNKYRVKKKGESNEPNNVRGNGKPQVRRIGTSDGDLLSLLGTVDRLKVSSRETLGAAIAHASYNIHPEREANFNWPD